MIHKVRQEKTETQKTEKRTERQKLSSSFAIKNIAEIFLRCSESAIARPEPRYPVTNC